jgi:hypothetical protein
MAGLPSEICVTMPAREFEDGQGVEWVLVPFGCFVLGCFLVPECCFVPDLLLVLDACFVPEGCLGPLDLVEAGTVTKTVLVATISGN